MGRQRMIKNFAKQQMRKASAAGIEKHEVTGSGVG